jgi:homoserine kinase type II
VTEEDIAHVLSHYNLGALQACRPAGHGYVNDNWFVETTRGCYFLKRRHPTLRDPVRIRAQHALIAHLRDLGFPVPAVYPTRAGTTLLQLGGEVYEIHEHIPGELCDPARPAHFAVAARTLGWYHEAVRGFDHPVFHQLRQRYRPAQLMEILARLTEAWQEHLTPEIRAMLAQLHRHTRDLTRRFREFGPLPELVIHGDYYAENLIFQGDTLVGVVDYDRARWTWRVEELAEAVIYFTAERPGHLQHVVYPGVLDLDAVRRFLASYAQRTRLLESEARALPHVIRTIWMCASLDPPLRPPPSVEEAPQALPEVLILADWAETRAMDIVEIGLSVCTDEGQKTKDEG